MEQTATAIVKKVDGDRLAEALRRITPFMASDTPPNLACVYAESQGGVLQLTATDGYRMAHLTVALPFPDGNWLLKAAGVKDFSQRHYNGEEVNVGPEQLVAAAEPAAIRQDGRATWDALKMGDVWVELETSPYIDYPAAVPEDSDMEVIIDTKAWIKLIRQHKPEVVGVVFSSAGCRMYLQSQAGETVACESVPVQMFSGPDKKVAYHGERFRRALTSCGPTATIQVGDPAKATILEAEDYWHIIVPTEGFPREVSMSNTEREAIKWAQEALEAVRKGEVLGIVLIGRGKFYLEIGAGVTQTQVLMLEPKLTEEAAAAAARVSQVAQDESGQED